MAERGRVALFGYELKQLLRDTDAPMLAACAADGDHEICFALVQIVGQQEGKQILGFCHKIQRLLVFEHEASDRLVQPGLVLQLRDIVRVRRWLRWNGSLAEIH